MDSTSPATESIVGSTNAQVAVASFVAFAINLVERFPLPHETWLDGDGRGVGGSDQSATPRGSYPG